MRMTHSKQHPITPPSELIEQWMQAHSTKYDLARQAAQWGADRELEACCEWREDNAPAQQLLGHTWVDCEDPQETAKHLHAARRPKPPSLKEQALDELHISFDRGYLKEGAADIIRRALEALPDD